MRTILVIGLAVLTAVVALAPVEGQQPPGKSKSAPPPAAKTNPSSPAPAPAANAPPPPPAAAAPDFPTQIGGRTIEAWIKEIDSIDPSVRDHAIKMVIYFGPNARKAIPALNKQARRTLEDISPQASAILALGVITPYLNSESDKATVKTVVDALTYALDNPQAIIKYRAAISLAQIGPAGRTAVPKLAQLVKNRTTFEIRHAACMALGRAGVDENGLPNMQALGALVDCTKDDCKEVRIEALQSIITLGPPASGDITALKNLLDQRLKAEVRDKSSVTIWVRIALMRLDPKAVNNENILAIAKVMKDGGDADVRAQAALGLYYIGTAAKVAIPDLIDVLKSDEALLVIHAAAALGRMESDAAIPSLETLASNHKNDEVKAAAKAAIEEIKKKK